MYDANLSTGRHRLIECGRIARRPLLKQLFTASTRKNKNVVHEKHQYKLVFGFDAINLRQNLDYLLWNLLIVS